MEQFRLYLKDNLNTIQKELKTKKYLHSPYTTFYVQDPKLRKINKACVRDRIVHHTIFSRLYPIFEATFIFDSYSCRFGKGTHRAVRRLHEFFRKESGNNSRPCYVLKCDIKKFFDSIDQGILFKLMVRRVKDREVLWLISAIIKSFPRGLPLGNITSQLFANIYLHELDAYIKHDLKVKYYIRYCDDFVILHTGKDYLEKLIPNIDCFLQNTLKLSLHPNKVTIRNYRQGIDFLGYVSFPSHTIVRVKTAKRMLKKITSLVKNFRNGKIKKEFFHQSIQAYFGVLCHCKSYKLKQQIHEIIKTGPANR